MKDCITKDFKLYGANEKINKDRPESRIRRYVAQQSEVQDTLMSVYHLSPEVAEHLSHFYGYRAYQVAEIAKKENDQSLHPFFHIFRLRFRFVFVMNTLFDYLIWFCVVYVLE